MTALKDDKNAFSTKSKYGTLFFCFKVPHVNATKPLASEIRNVALDGQSSPLLSARKV
jgi:hypothetical protein